MNNLYIFSPEKIGTISPNIYGHFAEHLGGVIYDGMWVGESSNVPNIKGFRAELVEKLKAINPPILRWPGGCFAETYDWRDGIGPRDKRPVRLNWWTTHGDRREPNEVGTDEFVYFCRLIGAEPYIAANVTTLKPLDIRDWIDYCNSPRGTTTYAKLREQNGNPEPFGVKYWGVGNETWGGGGNMTAEVYAHEYRRYAMIMSNTDPSIKLIGSGANANDFSWTKRFMEVFSTSDKIMSYFSLHYYCWGSGNPVAFNTNEWYQQLVQAAGIENCLRRHWNYICGFGMEKYAKLCIDEWGAWHPEGSGPSKGYNLFEQQSSMRDAMVAALTLNIFNNNCDKVAIAAVAQLVNCLHSLFLASGPNLITTPTYHVFDMYKGHQGGEAVKTVVDNNEDITFTSPVNGRESHINKLSYSASIKDGKLTLTVANLSHDTSEVLQLVPIGIKLAGTAQIGILTHSDYHAHNTFEDPENVKAEYKSIDISDGVLTIPAASIIALTADII